MRWRHRLDERRCWTQSIDRDYDSSFGTEQSLDPGIDVSERQTVCIELIAEVLIGQEELWLCSE